MRLKNCCFCSHFGDANSILLYNKTLSKHVTALFCLYLGNVTLQQITFVMPQ